MPDRRRKSKPVANIIDAEDFLGGLYPYFDRLAFQAKIRFGLAAAGYRSRQMEHIPKHKLTLTEAERPTLDEVRPDRQIKANVLNALRREGLSVMADMVLVRRAGRRMTVTVGVLEGPGA